MADADAIVVGAGLAGLVAATELTGAGRRVVVVEQESRTNLGGQAFWSFGGLFFVDSPEQRRMGVKDSVELAWQDWLGTAGFDRPEDHWPGLWARAYVDFAAGEKRAWLHEQGMRWFPVVGWAERGDGHAGGHGNSVPRFHVTWGTGPGVVEPFVRKAIQAERDGLLTFAFRHRVDDLVIDGGAVTGVRGAVLATATESRGHPTNRDVVGDFSLSAPAVDRDVGRDRWQPRPRTGGMAGPARYAARPSDDRCPRLRRRADDRNRRGAPAARVINRDRMWHYVEGIHNWAPIWPGHAHPDPARTVGDVVRRQRPIVCPRRTSRASTPSARWPTCVRPATTIRWFVLTQKVIEKEFALSGSEQNPDLTGKSVAPGARPRPPRSPETGSGVRGPRRGLRDGHDDPGVGGADEHAHPGRTARRRRHRAAGGRTRPQPRQRLLQGRSDHRDPRRPEIPRRQAHPHGNAAQVPRPR